ncbi:MAG: nitrilase-related carbon-nitrogen hydrolase, partial [Erythrobacter sp.]
MHLAGFRIRQWREAHDPPLSAEEFGLRYGDPWPSRTVYGWEAKGKIARAPVQKRLAQLGICSPQDWLEPAPAGAGDAAGGQAGAESGDAEVRAHPFYDMRRHGFVRVATSTPKVRTADIAHNIKGILAEAERAHEAGVDLVLYPELCISSYAIDDLHLQAALLDAAEAGLGEIVAASAKFDPLLLVGAPLRHNGRVYNCAAVVARGHLLGVIPKSYLPNYREYYEKRWFAHGREIRGLEIA